MNSRAGIVVITLAAILVTIPTALAQMNMQPTPTPIVTADNEAWYQAGIPISHAGNTYYPAGALVHFNANEMVRTGHFQGIPLYSRTTIEPYSLVFVPLSGGLMQPYERRRAGDVADTVGSLTPSFPVVRPAEQSGMEFVPGAGLVQAPAPPSQVGAIEDRILTAAPAATAPAATGAAIGTAGSPAATVQPATPIRLATARRPQGLNGVFIDFGNRRYFADGPAVSFNEQLFTRIGDYRGFPVYQQRGQERTVYIPPLAGTPGLVAPYRAR